jgi:hypothetical protein
MFMQNKKACEGRAIRNTLGSTSKVPKSPEKSFLKTRSRVRKGACRV